MKAKTTDKQTLDVFAKEALFEYGSYVVGNRAVPDFRDGLKPSHRAILWAMCDLGLRSNTPYKKAARPVGDAIGKYHPHGDCLAGETLVLLLEGKLARLDSLCEGKPKWVLAWDEKAQKYVPAKAHSWRVGQQATKTYKITLSDGSKIEATGNHPFLSKETGWVRTEDLKPGTFLEGALLKEEKYLAIRSPSDARAIHNIVAGTKEGCVVHHRNERKWDNRPKNLEHLTRAEHAAEHSDGLAQLEGLATARKRMFGKSEPGLRKAIKRKNSKLMSIHNEWLWLTKALKVGQTAAELYGKLTPKTYEAARTKVYNGTKLETLLRKHVDLEELGRLINAGWKPSYDEAKGHTKKFRKAKVKKPSKGFTEATRQETVLQSFMEIVKFMTTQVDPEDFSWKSYSFFREKLIKEYAEEHGSVRMYEVPPEVVRVYTSPKAAKLKARYGTFWKAMRKASPNHGLFVRKVEAVKYKVAKPMYDFTVNGYENLCIAVRNKKHTTLVVAHNSALYGAMVTLANTVPPAVDGQGNWGSPNSGAAAYRYTEARMSKFTDMFLLSPEYVAVVPKVPNFSRDLEIPLYLPALLPFALLNGSPPVPAYGVSSGNPAFTVSSVAKVVTMGLRGQDLDAKVLAKTLVPAHEFGCNVVQDRKNLRAVMSDGRGALQYTAPVVGDRKARRIYITSFLPGKLASVSSIQKTLDTLANFPGVKRAYSQQSKKLKQSGPYGACFTLETQSLKEKEFEDLLDKVQKQVTTSVSVRFAVVVRYPDKPSKFHYLNFVRYFKSWIKYRIDLEVSLLKKQIADTEAKIHVLKVYLWAVDNLDALLAALKKVLVADDPVAALAKKFKLSKDDANIVLQRKVIQLARLERADLVKQIKELEDQLTGFKKGLKDPGPYAAQKTEALVTKYLKNPDKLNSGVRVL